MCCMDYSMEKKVSATESPRKEQIAVSKILVAFGVVVHLILTNAPSSELDRYIAFMLSVNLPVTFELLGIPNVTDEELRAVAKLACSPGETIWSMDIGDSITEDKVFYAIKGADAVSREYIRRASIPKAKL